MLHVTAAGWLSAELLRKPEDTPQTDAVFYGR
jgi:hypothetical protein